jgi:hypothetical protein
MMTQSCRLISGDGPTWGPFPTLKHIFFEHSILRDGVSLRLSSVPSYNTSPC